MIGWELEEISVLAHLEAPWRSAMTDACAKSPERTEPTDLQCRDMSCEPGRVPGEWWIPGAITGIILAVAMMAGVI
jgi:hypothetical protein